MKSNIEILKNYIDGIRPISIFGYTGKQYIKHNVGDHWIDSDGVQWEQKKSGAVRVNPVAEIIKKSRGLEICKACSAEIRWGGRTDKILFRKTGLCTDCLINYETKLRIVGIYDDYEKYKLISNEIGFLKDMKDKIDDTIKFFSSDSGDVTAICNSNGFIERWKNTNSQKILSDAKRDLKEIRKRIAVLSQKKSEFRKNFLEGAKKHKMEIYV